jgi:tRNA-specific 2-thiouridylase
MRSLDFPCEKENVFTSGMAAGMFLQENKKASLVYVCGTESLKTELKKYGVNISEDGIGADTVLLGYDTELDYKKIRIVCDLLDGGADYYATGHYAQIEHTNNEHILYSGKDLPKDQSYFLNQLSVSQLEKVLFPLGCYSKPEVREIAEKIGLDNANRKDSYDVCFLGSEKFKNYIEKFIPKKSGNIVDVSSGNVVGKHTGLSKYTIGQRKGLGIGGGFGKTLDAWFVSKKDLKTNTLYVEQGNGESLYSDTVIVENFNWISNKPESQMECFAKFRYRQDFQKVRVEPLGGGVVILCDEKQRAVTPGQFAVLYRQENDKYKCLGGGKITALKRDGKELDL